MKDIPKLSLLEVVEDTAFEHAVFLTYGIDLPFFEDSIIRALLRQETRNIAVFADGKHVAQQMRHLSEMRHAREKWNHCGKVYSLTGVHHHTAFHPKVALLVGEEEVQLWVGSGNLETGGIRSNLEIHNVVKTDAGGESDQDACLLITQAWEYIRAITEKTGAKVVAGQLDQIEEALPWLRTKIKGASGAFQLVVGPQDDAVKAIVKAVDGDKVDRLIVLSPFFDKDFRTLKSLVTILEPKKVQVLIQSEMTSMDGSAASKLADVDFYELRAPSDRYAHAKVLLVECRKKEVLFSGSHNLSERGMGAENYEASILRISDQPCKMLSELKLEQDIIESNRVSKSDIEEMSIIVRPAKEGAVGASLLESAEFSGDSLVLKLRHEIKSKRVGLLVYKDSSMPEKDSRAIRFDSLTANIKIPAEAIHAWSALAIDVDGKASAPVPILHTVELATRASRNRKFRELSKKAANIGPGLGEIEELIEDLRSVFFDEWRPSKTRAKSVPDGSGDTEDAKPKQLNYEDFIIPLEGRPVEGERHHVDASRSASDAVLGAILAALGGTKVPLGGKEPSDDTDAPPDDLSSLAQAPSEEEEAQAVQSGKMEGEYKEDDDGNEASVTGSEESGRVFKIDNSPEAQFKIACRYISKFEKMVWAIPDQLESRFEGDRPISIYELEILLTSARLFTGLAGRKQAFGNYEAEYLTWNNWGEAQAGLLDVLTTSRLKVLSRLPWKRAGHGTLRALHEGLAGWCLSVRAYIDSPDIEEETRMRLKVGLRLAGQLLGIDHGMLSKAKILKATQWILDHATPGTPMPVLDFAGWVKEVGFLRKADIKLRGKYKDASDIECSGAGFQSAAAGMWAWWPAVEGHIGLITGSNGNKIDLQYEANESKTIIAKYAVAVDYSD
jgi:hypothetical protein